jgi:AAA-like domain/CHAT domain
MSDIFYRNFDMQILRAGEEYLAQTESPDAGNASLNFTLPFSEDGLEALLSKLGPARRVRGVETPIEAAKRLGGQLYKAVFSSGIGSALDRSIEAANRESERLRIRLRLTNVPELANLPWEYLYDEPNDRFLALSYKTSIVRYLGVPQPVNPLAVKPPLRVLVMASSPIGYDALGVDKEWSNLQTALGKMPRGLVEVDRTEKAALEALQERLSGGDQYHIFHYIGHGGFDPRTGKSVLVMEDDHRQARFVDGPQLGVLLHNHPSLRLAILNACEGAVANQNDVFTGVAQNLIRQEMPAVIAMQFEITDSVAIILAKAFYESLARNAPVDMALAEARLAVFAADNGIEWGTPVLYLRAHDGRLFDVEQPPLPPPPPPPPETPEREKLENLPPTEPSGTLSPSSSFYIEREADKKAMEMIAWPGITLSIKASGQTGASSLLRRLMEAARKAGKQVAHINFQQVFNDEDLTNSDDFHYRFCLALTHELDLEDRVTQYWEQYKRLSIGHRCTRYLRYLLQSLGPQPLTIAMDEIDRLIDAGFRSSFFSMLRTWHNDRAVEGLFERMDLVLVTSLDPDQLIDDPKSGSPFNVGDLISLNDFTPEEVGRLNDAYGAPLTTRQIERLMALIGGHPYLLQRAFHQIATYNLTIDQVCGQGIQESGLFGRHLSSWFAFLQRNPFLKENLQKVLSRSEPDWNAFLSLRKLGLVRREGARTLFRCKLYEDYFREQFHSRRDP